MGELAEGILADLGCDDRMDLIVKLLRIEFRKRRDNDAKGSGSGPGNTRES